MAKITRVTSSIFAGGAASQDIEQFGSKVQGGSPNYTTDPAVIQSLAAWADGWSAALVVANKSEYKQDRNAVDYVASYQISYLLQQGVAEWDAGTTYYTNSVVQSGGLFYISLTDSNLANTPASNPTDWRNMSAQPTTTALTSGSGTYTPPAGCVYISVRMVGGGAGASGNGGDTTFGAFTAGGGKFIGIGGSASGGSVNINGASSNGTSPASSAFGGAGTSGTSAAANSGSGAAGGGAGGYVEGAVSSPGATSYAVGAAGSGSLVGGSGLILISEYYY